MEEWAIILKNKVVQRFTIDEGQILFIGRGSDSNVIIDNMSVSRKHCSLEYKNGVYYLTDWHSINGTRVDGKEIHKETQISKSSHLQLGKFVLKPTSLLVDEVDAGSVVSTTTNEGDFNKTLAVSGIYKAKENTEETIEKPSKGYRLLTVLEGGGAPSKVVLKKRGVLKAGKEPSCQLILTGSLISKIQFTIDFRQNGFFISDKGGILKKTLVNGNKIKDAHRLQPMDVIEVGNIKIRYS
jgi:pSer/pThr/pTyr-binding forkhead associated (FHA) protein